MYLQDCWSQDPCIRPNMLSIILELELVHDDKLAEEEAEVVEAPRCGCVIC